MVFDETNSIELHNRLPEISVIIPAYDESDNINEIHKKLIEKLMPLDIEWEIIFIDDGSSDQTWEKILRLHENNASVKGIRLSRNFGHQHALLAGLSHAIGKAVISMDADLQHPPHIIEDLITEWKKGNKIVNTIRLNADDISFFKKITSDIFYKLFGFLSGVKLEKGMADYRLLDRQVVNSILEFREEALFLRGIVQWVGFPSSIVKFKSQKRHSGKTKYTVGKMIKFAWHGISSFSIIPLRIGILIGVLTSIISFGGIIYALYSKFIIGSAVPGWASSVSIVSFLLGILFILLGIIGEYIGRILIEVKRRPRFLISDQAGIDWPEKSKNAIEMFSTLKSKKYI